MRKFIVFLTVLLFLSGCEKKVEEIPEVLQYEEIQINAIWFSYVDYRDNMQNLSEKNFSKKVDEIINNFVEDGINTIYLHTVSFTDAFYDSKIYPKTQILPEIDYDPLNIFLEKAHNKSIRVEAWINPMRSFTVEEASSISDDFIIKKWINEEKPYVKNVNGRYYLNPAYQEVIDLILSVVKELVNDYDIDGIHMDDYFYPDDVTEEFDFEIYTERCLNICSLSRFRKDNVNNLVALINKEVKKAGLVYGISPSGNMSYSVDTVYGDFNAWVDAGTVDYLIPQIYWGYDHPTKPFKETLDEWIQVIKDSDVDLIVGLAAYKIAAEDIYAKDGKYEWIENTDIISRQIEDAKLLNTKGISLFSYQSLYEPDDDIKEHVNKEKSNIKLKLKE
ncbi:MAG: family 10 glycosylhydrolase [Erysipelotrichaceae bacterium]|nr:family 10 glycosylhydrolase [Erysipelotrichaceae bacterium]